MSNEVLYRKWRPRTFAEVAGQDVVTRTLANGVASGKVSHAYLFSGPRGTGKTTTGRLLAKAINCTNAKDGEPCNACESCQAYQEARALDLIELDAASNRGIDEIRNLREKANFAPSGGVDAHKVYLVDEVHMLTEPAFNALLKTLEEPPAHVIFVLATTEAHKVPATVASRCQRFDFRRIPLAAAVDRLALIAKEEGFSVPQDALEAIARAATGSLRDSINLLEQFVDSYGPQLTLDHVRDGLGLVVDARSADLAAHALRQQLSEGLSVIAAVRDDGLDLRQFQRQVVAQLRGLLLVKAGAPSTDTWSDEQIEAMRAVVESVPAERIVAALRAVPLSPLPLELALAGTVMSAAAPAPAAQPAAAPQPRQQPAAKAPARAKAPPAKDEPADAKPAPSANAGRAAKPEPSPESDPVPPANGPAKDPAPAKPAATKPADPSATLEQVRERWPDVYQRTREIDHRTGAYLNSGCDIVELTDAEIVFGFRHKLHLDKMTPGGEHSRALQQAVNEVLGEGRTVRCVLDPDIQAAQPARGGHLVRAAEEILSDS